MGTPDSPAAALPRTFGAAALALTLGGCEVPFEPDEGPISAPSRQIVSDSARAVEPQ
jgi:hypothetical protein